jgi:hypothetical protein
MHSSVDGILLNILGHALAQLIEALRYEPKDRGFDSRWRYWNFFMSTRNISWGAKADSA